MIPEEEGVNDDERGDEDSGDGSSDEEGADEAKKHRWWKRGNDSKAYSKEEQAYYEVLGIFSIFKKAAGSVAEFWAVLKTAELGTLATKFTTKVKKPFNQRRRYTKAGQAFKVGNVRQRRPAFKRFGRGEPSASPASPLTRRPQYHKGHHLRRAGHHQGPRLAEQARPSDA